MENLKIPERYHSPLTIRETSALKNRMMPKPRSYILLRNGNAMHSKNTDSIQEKDCTRI